MLSIKKLLTKITVLLKGAVIVRSASITGSVRGNTNEGFYFTPPSVSGYTYVGIVGVRNSHGANFPITDFDSLNKRVVIRNLTATTTDVTITAILLYVKNELWGGGLLKPVFSRLSAVFVRGCCYA